MYTSHRITLIITTILILTTLGLTSTIAKAHPNTQLALGEGRMMNKTTKRTDNVLNEKLARNG